MKKDYEYYKNLYFHEDFNPKSALEFSKSLDWIPHNDGKDNEVTIFLNSYGGQVDSLEFMISRLNKFKEIKGNKIRIVGSGMIASCAYILLTQADEIELSNYCSVLIHQVYYFYQGNDADIQREKNASKPFNNYINKINEKYLTADEIEIYRQGKDIILTGKEFTKRFNAMKK